MLENYIWQLIIGIHEELNHPLKLIQQNRKLKPDKLKYRK